jgi:hypothetical protein
MPAYRPALSKRAPCEGVKLGWPRAQRTQPAVILRSLIAPGCSGARDEPQLPPVSGKNCGA